MNIKIRSLDKNSNFRLENRTSIQEIIINEDLFHPESESIAIGFKNENSSGLIEITPSEFEKLYDQVKNKLHLIKGFKRLSASGAIRIK